MKIRADRGRRRARWGRASGRVRGVLLVATVVALLASVFAEAGFSATTTKPYKTDITPNSVAAGSSTNFTAKITNEATPQQLGSANITAPTGFTVTGVVRGVRAPGGDGDAGRQRRAAAQPRTAARQCRHLHDLSHRAVHAHLRTAWTVTAKQSNDFNGPPGNDFTLDHASNLAITVLSGGGGGASQLHFFTEPADAAINTPITSTPFKPDGHVGPGRGARRRGPPRDLVDGAHRDRDQHRDDRRVDGHAHEERRRRGGVVHRPQDQHARQLQR